MTLAELASGPPLDAAIVGGGINGAAIALTCARLGLNVALFEQDDFGSGTTWRSTRLIHGGLRYLEHGELGLVFESLRERAWLLRARPYLVRPQRFLLPLLPWTRRPRWQLYAGLALYDLLGGFRAVPRHRGLSRERLLAAAPALDSAARGGLAFYDARILAPERLALEMVLEARRLGAAVHNHARVGAIGTRDGAVASITVEAAGERAEIAARAVISAAGPWVDAVRALAGAPGPEIVGATRGAHIVLEPGTPLPPDAIFSTAQADGRVIFVVPEGNGLLLVGTTDDRFDGDPGTVQPTPADVRYLLAEVNALLPGLALGPAHVRYAFAGVRPLLRDPGKNAAAVSRRHAVIDHAARGGPRGLWSVAGGKLSTFRPLAIDVAKRVAPAMHVARDAFLPPARHWRTILREHDLDHGLRQHLRIYGDAVEDVLALGGATLCEHAHAVEGEVRHAATAELATSLEDTLLRRTAVGWAACRGLCCHQRAAELLAAELGWDGARVAAEVERYEAAVAHHLPPVESLIGEGR